MRPLNEIAREIDENWTAPYYGAVPYLRAMLGLKSISDYCGNERGSSVVRYFLSNAGSWRGDVARRVKAELREMVK